VPSYRGGTAQESYKLQVCELFDDAAPRWTFDTGMGTPSSPSEGDHRADWDYEWTFKPVAWDIDGDSRAEIITLARIDGKYKYVVLKDEGATYRIMATMDSPIPVADDKNNSRHFPFFADLGGKHCSFLLQGGTYGAWQMWAYDWNGSRFTERWHIDSAAGGFQGNRSSSHTILVVDLDGDGRDEINNGATVLRPDGTVLWTANGDFGPNAHVDGQVIDDIDPDNPGLELVTFAEKGGLYALYDARTGKRLWVKHAPAAHLQCNIAAVVTGGKVLYEVDLSDAPKGDCVPWNEHHLYNLWFNVDIVADYREDIPVQMPDGSVRVYVNTKTPPGRKPCKWQDRAYQMLQAPGDYRYFIRTLYGPQGPPPQPAAPGR
jgi:hypothetical protein